VPPPTFPFTRPILTFHFRIRLRSLCVTAGGPVGGRLMNKLRVRDNERGQFQVKLTSTEGTITCVVSVAKEMTAPERRQTALRLAKALVGRLDGEIGASRQASEPMRRCTGYEMTGVAPSAGQ
jgi:hypothetical protein